MFYILLLFGLENTILHIYNHEMLKEVEADGEEKNGDFISQFLDTS